MDKAVFPAIAMTLLSSGLAEAACIGASGQSLNGRVFSYTLDPLARDVERFVRLTPGAATVDVRVVERGAPVAGCSGNDAGLEFDIAWTRTGPQTPCLMSDEEGPALALLCRFTARQQGRYFVRMRNPGCRSITYELRCRNGYIAQ